MQKQSACYAKPLQTPLIPTPGRRCPPPAFANLFLDASLSKKATASQLIFFGKSIVSILLINFPKTVPVHNIRP